METCHVRWNRYQQRITNPVYPVEFQLEEIIALVYVYMY